METLFNNQSEIFTWVVLPILIFIARICDVSIGTIRMIYVSKGLKLLASVLGFFEVSIWILAIGQIMKHMDSIVCFLAYGSGYAMGNYIGILLEEKLSIGTVIMRIIPRDDASELIIYLRTQNIGLTVVDGEGSMGKVKVIFSVIQRTDINHVISVINEYNPTAFYSVEDVKVVKEGIFKKGQGSLPFNIRYLLSKKR
jgi:uncharacterized protein YebE (UPF0316 family)